MLLQISNVLFLCSLALLIGTLIYKGFGRRGTVKFYDQNMPNGSYTSLQLKHDHLGTIQSQESFMKSIVKSYLVWLSIAGIAVSYVIRAPDGKIIAYLKKTCP